MNQLTTILFLLLSTCCSTAQYRFDQNKVSPSIQKIISKLEKEGEVMGSAVYYSGERPEQYNNFTKLLEKASKEELMELTNHPNGVVRCYAFWALSSDSTVRLLPVLVDHLNDTARVFTQFGCVGGREKVGDFFINITTMRGEAGSASEKLTASELAFLDSLLLYTPNMPLSARYNALDRAKPTEGLYKRVREIVLMENEPSAVILLAKYKKEEDIPLILSEGQRDNLYYTYQAIAAFPHPDFFPFLRRKLEHAMISRQGDSEWRILYQAIASYKNDSAFVLLQIPYNRLTDDKNWREHHLSYVFQAIMKYYSPEFDPLLWSLWENDTYLSEDAFMVLYPKDRNRAFQLAKMTMAHPAEFYKTTEGNNSAGMWDRIMDLVCRTDRVNGIELIGKSIAEANVHQFGFFADKALEMGDSSLVSALFDRLEKEWNAHVYLKIIGVLLQFKDPEINSRIGEVVKRNPALTKDWGGKIVEELLLKNGIK